MSSTHIAQAVVTDPGGGSAGYALVAASPALAAEDAELLERSPGVSEYLHTEVNPRPCFSFFQLPSGFWALSRRFVSGKRRGEFNRIVAHTLVLADDVLRALAEEPSLLTSHCTFQPSGEESATFEFFELGKIVADPGVRELADLSCRPPADVTQALIDLTTQRRNFLLRSFDEAELEERLGTVYGALEKNHNVLLPQEPAYEELLRLAWSSLPPADRRQVPWTTHFAPGVRTVFRLLNAPNPLRAREQQTHPEHWRLLDPRGPTPDPGARALAAAVAWDRPPLALRLGDLGRWPEHLRLFGGQGAVGRWLAWVTHWSRQIEEGCDSLEELQDFYDQVSRASKLDPWIQAGAVLRCTCHSVRKLTAAEGPDRQRHRQTLDAVYEALTEHGLAETVLEVATLAPWSRGTFGELEAVAVALALRAQLPPPRGRAGREGLFDVWVAGLDVDFGPVTGAVLLDLAFELVSCHSPAGRQILFLLASESPRSVDLARDRLAALADPLAAGAMLLEVLRQVGGDWQAPLSDLVDGFLVPQLAGRGELEGGFDAELLSFALQSASPEGLAGALASWGGKPYDLAVGHLRAWILEQPELARRAVTVFEAEAGVPPTAALAGVSMSLVQLGVPAAHWMPFAVAEAAFFDGGDGARELADKVFMPLAGQALDEDAAAGCIAAVLAALSRNARVAGRCHRLLFRLVVRACPRVPEETTRALAGFFDAAPRGLKAGAELFEWGTAIAEARTELNHRRLDAPASRLVASWWQALARVAETPPQELVPTLEWLRPVERHSVARAWLHRAQDLAQGSGGEALVQALQDLTGGDEDLSRAFLHAKLEGEVHPESRDLAARLNELHQQVGGDPTALQELLDARALPSGEPERSFAVLELLTSPEKLWPTVYEVLEVDFLVSAVEEVLESRHPWLKDVERLTAREQVLVRVAKKLGQMAHKDLSRPVEFLDWALDAAWPAATPGEPAAQRDLFVATLLASSEIARERSWDLIDGLFETGQTELLQRLGQMAAGSQEPYLRRLADASKGKLAQGKLAQGSLAQGRLADVRRIPVRRVAPAGKP